MAATFKIRITDLVDTIQPFFGWTMTEPLGTTETFKFYFVEERTGLYAYEAIIGPDLNAALKEAVDYYLAAGGEYVTSMDDFYLYIECQTENRSYSFTSNTRMVYTAEILNATTSEIGMLQPLPAGALLNAFNDNVIRFTYGDHVLVNVEANQQLPLTLYPSPSGEYYLNLQPFSSVLINGNRFEDAIVPDIDANGYVVPDPSLFLAMELKISIDASIDVATYHFLKSVAQIANYADRMADENHILLPSPKVTYYEGYPFDISVYAAQSQDITLHNRTTGLSADLSMNQYTNRLFFSQGSDNFTIDDVLPLQTGYNRMELEFGPTDKIDLTVQKKESKCAPYFKFYRNCGGYGYIRFESEVGVKNSASEGESIRTDFNGIQNTIRRSIAEKTATVEMELQTEQLEAWEMENFKDFISSPYVMMYTGDLYQKATDKSWVGVRVTSSGLFSKRPKANKLKERVNVEFDLYNLSL